MKFVAQELDSILATLQPISVEWQDDVARRVVATIEAWPVKHAYELDDVRRLLNKNFDDGLLICRLFLGLSKDQFTTALREALNGSCGITAYRRSRKTFLEGLLSLGLLQAIAEQANRTPKWSDVLVERLRSGRAISGQRRGRKGEDFMERSSAKSLGAATTSAATFSGPHQVRFRNSLEGRAQNRY